MHTDRNFFYSCKFVNVFNFDDSFEGLQGMVKELHLSSGQCDFEPGIFLHGMSTSVPQAPKNWAVMTNDYFISIFGVCKEKNVL